MSNVSFIHVPRTGGMSVLHHMKAQLGSEVQWIGAKFYDHGLSHQRIQELNARFTGGHHGWGDLPDVQWVTVMRNPVDRVLSYYWQLRHLSSRPKTAVHRGAKTMDLKTWVEMEWPGINNLATSMLAGSSGLLPVIEIDMRAFHLANRHLEDCVLVGVTTRLQTFVNTLTDFMGLEKRKIGRKNQGAQLAPKRGSISTHLEMIIENLNQFDMELWRRAEQLAS